MSLRFYCRQFVSLIRWIKVSNISKGSLIIQITSDDSWTVTSFECAAFLATGVRVMRARLRASRRRPRANSFANPHQSLLIQPTVRRTRDAAAARNSLPSPARASRRASLSAAGVARARSAPQKSITLNGAAAAHARQRPQRAHQIKSLDAPLDRPMQINLIPARRRVLPRLRKRPFQKHRSTLVPLPTTRWR